jgi:hypothetical protein
MTLRTCLGGFPLLSVTGNVVYSECVSPLQPGFKRFKIQRIVTIDQGRIKDPVLDSHNQKVFPSIIVVVDMYEQIYFFRNLHEMILSYVLSSDAKEVAVNNSDY